MSNMSQSIADLFTLFAVSRIHLFHVCYILLQIPHYISWSLLRLPKERHDCRLIVQAQISDDIKKLFKQL